MPYGKRRWSSGSSLVEVMISLFVLVTSLLGFSAMQLNSLQLLSNNQQHASAVKIAASMADALRANASAVRAGHYDGLLTTPAVTVNCRLQACSSSELAAFDKRRWLAAVSRLPQGRALIERQPAQNGEMIRIRLCWRRDRGDGSHACTMDAQGASPSSVVFQLRVLL